jgi:hypothetical protein
MKKQMMKLKTIAVAGILAASNYAFADNAEIEVFAHCTLQNAHKGTFAVERFDFISLYLDSKVIVNRKSDMPEELVAQNYMPTWMTYASTFERKGQTYKFQFPNYISPSIGRLFITSGQIIETFEVACQLRALE